MRVPLILAALSVFCLSDCASQLDRDLTDNTPKGAGVLAIDLSKVGFVDVTSGEEITVADYMAQTQKDFLLLTFGSTGCGICNTKNFELATNIVGKHALYGTDPGSRFEIIGINTEREELPLIQRKLRGNDLVRWYDFGGANMMKFFAAEGASYAIPLTALINREGIMLRKLPADKYSVFELMEEVADKIGAGSGDPSDPVDPVDPVDPEDPEENVPVTAFDYPQAGRLKSVNVTTCNGDSQTLYDAVGRATLRLIQVANQTDGCDQTCTNNATLLTSRHHQCAASEETPCSALTLVSEEQLPQLCEQGLRVAAGGEEFWQKKYQALFDYQYRPIDEYPDYYLPPLDGPLHFAVHEDGYFADLRQGSWKSELLDNLIAKTDHSPAGAADFSLYTDKGYETLTDVYRRSQFTVVATWGTECSSCKAEIKHWAEAGQLEEFCGERPDFCQVYLHEIHEPESPFSDYEGFYQGILDGWEDDFGGFEGLGALDSSLPVMLDTTPSDGDGYLDRFFEGYLLARYPEWGFRYRTVVYDREGKIIAGFIAPDEPAEVDPVLSKLQTLLSEFEGD